MSRRRVLKGGLAALLLMGATLAGAQTPERTVAVTFDDLPFASVPREDDETLLRMNTQLLGVLQAKQVPAVGFVNEAKLYREGELDPVRVDLLRAWLRDGLELGNHTFSHVSLNRTALDSFESDVLRGEAVTRPLMQAAGKTLRWFRHPFLHTGKTTEVRASFDAFLQTHGYVVAPVTINSSEWIFAVAYSRAQAAGDADAARQIGGAYLSYMAGVFGWVEELSFSLFGRAIPHVLLLHANSLNADYFGALADQLSQRGYRFIALEEALRDPAYRSHIGMDGREGESWLEGWARHAGLRPANPVVVPAFVTRWAGVAAYRGY